ncbi:ABC transporter ATP-binding protein [Spirilliplanes yamanashiensis]|uniref:Multidrug ABC transporter ATP-binding protein n=1 Tax=Spirilliplanes yamanashiensis TaxID=42233 RepID=A0A8J4DJT7_9ACTN|nr:ABC transporter ATP-binding protein [Spirilliplanes yamanashiensis]MDP9817013.1 ABC-2 type transport system ATP-binding protein [Spirilliplanes yamanashiensis]GIJ03330.1 multidrug ABC transporter ATP-binding protein [Spirilliplanes yamanashiensis]
METAVAVEGLTVDRGKRTVLHDISFSVPRGTVVGLLGPSGSGKTTLLRCIVGVQLVRAGRVTVLGRPAGTAELRRTVGYLTQAPSVYADLTVRENARYFAALYGLGAAEADRAVADVGLADAAGQLVSTLSGGQHSRASLACALLGGPELLVLDEPTVGQDPLLREELWGRFHDLARGGTTLIVSSHVMDEARRCDRLLFIRDGRLVADDTPARLRAETGTDDLEQAFLHIARGMEGVAA